MVSRAAHCGRRKGIRAGDLVSGPAVPLPSRAGKKYAFVNSETDHGCPAVEIAQLVGVVDVTDPKKPFMVSELPRPFPPPGYPEADFCDHGQYGPHNTNNTQWSPYIEKQGDLV